MAIKNIIARGFGFNPGSVKYIPVRGYLPVEAPPEPVEPSGEAFTGAVDTFTFTGAVDTFTFTGSR